MRSHNTACRTRNLHRLRSVSPAYIAVVEDLGEWEDDMDEEARSDAIEEQTEILYAILSNFDAMVRAVEAAEYQAHQTGGMH